MGLRNSGDAVLLGFPLNSNGRFGLNIQKHIWQEVKENYRAFGDRVGWRRKQSWIVDYSDLEFSLDAPTGHLPAGGSGIGGLTMFEFMGDLVLSLAERFTEMTVSI